MLTRMSRAATIATGAAAIVVVAGLCVLAVPAFTAVGQTVTSLGAASSTTEPTGDEATVAETNTALNATEGTDYSTWSEDELAAARAKNPYSTVINHPSRFAGECRQNSVMAAGGTIIGAQMLVDMGATEYASGEVTLNDEGLIATYTVAPGDAGMAIGERFCIDYVTVFQYNDVLSVPHPGDILLLLPAHRL